MLIGLDIAADHVGIWDALIVLKNSNSHIHFYSKQHPPPGFAGRLSADAAQVSIWLLDGIPAKSFRQPYCIWFTGDDTIFWTDAPKGIGHYFRHRRLRKRLQGASNILVPTQQHAQQLIKQFGIAEKKIRLLPLIIIPDVPANKDEIKQKNWEGQEAFAGLGTDFVLALKAFSVFKKRQQSAWKLVWFAPDTTAASGVLTGYKYKTDVVLLPLTAAHQVLPAAYALICAAPGVYWHPAIATALRAGLPVIAASASAIAATCGGALLPVNSLTAEAVGEAMMQLYKDESLHQRLSHAALNTVNGHSIESVTNVLKDALAVAAPNFVAPKIEK